MELPNKSFTLIDHAKALVEGLKEGHKQNPSAGLDHAARNANFILGKLETLAERKKIAEAKQAAQGFEIKTPVEEMEVKNEEEATKENEETAPPVSNPPAKNPLGE